MGIMDVLEELSGPEYDEPEVLTPEPEPEPEVDLEAEAAEPIPEPETPVTTTNFPRGNSTSICLRLFS